MEKHLAVGHPKELGRRALMFLYFFLVISTFWVLKPLKKALFVSFYDAEGLSVAGLHASAADAEQLAKAMNIAVAFVAMVAFARLSTRLRRERLSAALATFCAVACVVFAFALRAPGTGTVWTFYLFGDLFSTLMVAGFFAFLNDSVSAEEAKRTYGFIGLGGVLGGVFGSMALAGLVDRLSRPTWALVCAGASLVILIVALAAGRLARRAELAAPPTAPALSPESTDRTTSAKIVFGSRYYLAILGMVCIYEVVSSTMDFQFSWTVSSFLDGDAIGRQFARVFLLTNIVSLCVQAFLTTPMMRRGLATALLVLPVTAGFGSLTFALAPMLWTGSLLNTYDNAFSYSIQQSAKESLYVPTPSSTKYRAKAFIDMFGQRVAKGMGVFVVLAVSLTVKDLAAVRMLSMVTLALVAAWLVLARYAGKHFDALAEREAEDGPGAPPVPAEA